MSIKKFMVFDQENVHEYNILVEETDKGVEYSLFMSDGEQWEEHAKGELILSMINNGDGVIFSKKLKKLDYSDLFELDVIYESMTHSTAWGITIDLKEIKEDLVELRNEYINDASEFGEFVDEVSEIDIQLIFINKNIKTFENALMCFETKIFEKRTTMGNLGEICLN